MAHILSIVIPTKNRELYCLSTVKSVLAYAEDVELIVQDSSDGDALQLALAAIADPRLRYNKVSSSLNMTENFDSALACATGEYVLMLGDDDGIAPGIFTALEACRRLGADSITSREFYAAYNWPDFRSKYSGDSAAGKLSMNLEFDSSVDEVDLDRGIEEFLHKAGQGCLSLPRIYHGLVSQALIQRIRQAHGACFFGVSPDVSFSFLAAVHSRRHLAANFPITIAGASGGSNAGRSALRTHKGELWEDPHMKHYRNEKWPSAVPEFFSVESVWAQASIAAVALEDGKYASRFNFALLYALMYLRHADQRKRIDAAIHSHLDKTGENRLWLRLRIGWYMVVLGADTARSAFRSVMARFVSPARRNWEAPDVESASVLLKTILQGQK